MKKLFIIVLILASCSSDTIEPPKQKELVLKYFLTFRASCEGGAKIHYFEVEEDLYYSIVNASDIPDCETWHSVKSIEGYTYEGYLSHAEVLERYEYPSE